MAHRLMKAALNLPGVVERQDGRRRLIKMDLSAIVPAPSFPTAVAACFGSSLWPLFEGSNYKEGIRVAFRDITGRTKSARSSGTSTASSGSCGRGGEVALLDRSPLLDEVIEAVLQHQVLSLEYTRFNGTVEHLRLEPLSIVVHDHQLYVVGRDGEGGLHPYRFSRISAVDVLADTFEYPGRTEYDPEQVFRDSFGIFLGVGVQDVELKLHKAVDDLRAVAPVARFAESGGGRRPRRRADARAGLPGARGVDSWGSGRRRRSLRQPRSGLGSRQRAVDLSLVYEGRRPATAHPSLRKAAGAGTPAPARARLR